MNEFERAIIEFYEAEKRYKNDPTYENACKIYQAYLRMIEEYRRLFTPRFDFFGKPKEVRIYVE